MKLSRFYSNKPDKFEPVDFVTGLNVVMAEIHLPENRNKDTHNLGKTTLGRLLDFGFLSEKDPKFFLFKHDGLFKEFVFFLEIERADKSFVTIRRSVEQATKIALKLHKQSHQDLSRLPIAEWDHWDAAFERARTMLDGWLDWRVLKPCSYRKVFGYLLRSQEDFREVFQVRKFSFNHADWKPFLSQLLGFDAKLVTDLYAKDKLLSEKKQAAQTIKTELGVSVEGISKIEGILLLKRQETKKKQALLEAFDFRSQDKEHTMDVVNTFDERIAALNDKRYTLSYNKKKVEQSLKEDQILFNPDQAQRLFKETGVLFQGQIKKDFEQLIAFNRAITEERYGYLQEELGEINGELKQVNEELNTLGKRRSEMLSFLKEADVLNKYKQCSDEIATLRAEIALLEQQRAGLHQLQRLGAEIRSLTEACGHLKQQIEDNVHQQHSDQGSLFSKIRVFFSEIVEEVINCKALLSVALNKKGHLEFKAEILDSSGNTTSADLGNTYRKLLCVAFDMALLRVYLDKKFPRFVYHDGVLESLDDRKKENLLEVVRRYADLGLQPVITLIDSDLPIRQEGGVSVFSDDEIVVKLHDEGERGRLFKMRDW